LPAPIFSIVTPTFNRVQELPGLINSIESQTLSYNLFEMIIVDDGSADGTEDMVKSIKDKIPFELRYLSQSNKGPGAARNLGAEISRGELVLFIDSDCEADSQWLETIYNTYKHDGFDAFGGPDAAKEDFSPLQKAIDFSMTSFFTTGGIRGHSKKPLVKFYPRTHNMGVKKNIYQKIGGFGNLRHGQDMEFSHRLLKSDAKVITIHDAVVYHRRRTSIVQFFRQVFNWGVARINLGNIHKDLLKPIHFLPSVGFVLAFLTCLGAFIKPEEFIPIVELGIAIFVILALYGGFKNKSAEAALLLIIVIPVQIFGYGLGFITALFRKIFLKETNWSGFTKRYYK